MDKPKPRRFQFGLRALLLAFVPVAIIALSLSWHLRRPVPLEAIEVNGTVTLDGQPLDEVEVRFFPIDRNGITALGETHNDGGFWLKTHVGGSTFVLGVLPGRYKVIVSVPPWNRRFGEGRDLDTSGLTAEVTVDGPNDFDFALTSE